MESAEQLRSRLESKKSPSPSANATPRIWFLCGQVAGESMRNVPLQSFPFRIGRRGDLSFCLPNRTVSSLHAEITEDRGRLIVTDLGSTNGTFVNGVRLNGSMPVQEDDLVQFADVPFRVRRHSAEWSHATTCENVCDRALALVQFDKLMSTRAVIPAFQPIVSLETGAVLAYEVLGRSAIDGLETPAAMFRAAEQLDLEVELSNMFRWEGIRTSATFSEPPHVFVNTHPRELVAPGLVESMKAARDVSPNQTITLEIHEAAVTNPVVMRELRAALKDLQIGLAYDDFGAGQNRLIELVEIRPDFLKFDMALIRNIHIASPERRQMLETLVRMTLDLGVVALAEGVESEEEGQACRAIGFALAQGFHYGRPMLAR